MFLTNMRANMATAGDATALAVHETDPDSHMHSRISNEIFRIAIVKKYLMELREREREN